VAADEPIEHPANKLLPSAPDHLLGKLPAWTIHRWSTVRGDTNRPRRTSAVDGHAHTSASSRERILPEPTPRGDGGLTAGRSAAVLAADSAATPLHDGPPNS
jgi:hypothetical protein